MTLSPFRLPHPGRPSLARDHPGRPVVYRMVVPDRGECFTARPPAAPLSRALLPPGHGRARTVPLASRALATMAS
jgi:hypothetical protein